MQLQGKIIFASATEQVTPTFTKRNLVVEISDNPQYPQEINIELHNANTELIAGMTKGTEVIVDTNLRGKGFVNREGVKVWFNTIVGWRVTRVGNAPAAGAPAQPAAAPTPPPVNPAAPATMDDDDLPF